MNKILVVLCIMAVLLTGCLHGRGTHEIPIARDYTTMEKECVKSAEMEVNKAHRVGAHHFAPYEMCSAGKYLKWALHERSENDKKGEWDYAALAKKYAAEAIAKGGIADKGIMVMPDNWEACDVIYKDLVAKYRKLDPCKAKLVAPVVYAHIEAKLSIAEHELYEKFHYVDAARHLRSVEPDIDAIWAKDTDNDGVRDMDDGDPWIPEDPDGYEDGDGIPEPKPHPVLDAVHFETDKADLNKYAQGYLKGIAQMMVDRYSESTIYLSGHTDSDASDKYNMDLSQRRVDAVAKYLTACGLAAKMIDTSHHGEAKPVAENNTTKGKAQNRRVELMLNSPEVETPYCK